MTEITLALPFAFPPPELAPDLVRALRVPALCALLSRSSRYELFDSEPDARTLPHERWLAHALGLPSPDARCAFAASAMRALGLACDAGHWFIINPVHIQVARNHLLLADPRLLQLSEPDARALFEAAKPYFDEIGQPLVYGSADTWFMRADDWADLDTATPDAAIGQNLSSWVPQGASARACRKLQNEVQMLWHAHPVNEQRQARGLAAVNSFWPWAGSPAESRTGAMTLAAVAPPSWLAPLTGRVADPAAVFAAAASDQLVVCANLIEPAIATDWSRWLDQMQQLEQNWFAPALAALTSGRVRKLHLMLSHRARLAELTTTGLAQRKFWHRPTLTRLLP